MRCPPTGLLGRLQSKTAQAALPGQLLDGAARLGDSAMLKHVSSKGLACGAAGLAGRQGALVPAAIRSSAPVGLAGCPGDARTQCWALSAASHRHTLACRATVASKTCCPQVGQLASETKADDHTVAPVREPDPAKGREPLGNQNACNSIMRVTCTAPQCGQSREGWWTPKHIVNVPKRARLSSDRGFCSNCRDWCGFYVAKVGGEQISPGGEWRLWTSGCNRDRFWHGQLRRISIRLQLVFNSASTHASGGARLQLEFKAS